MSDSTFTKEEAYLLGKKHEAVELKYEILKFSSVNQDDVIAILNKHIADLEKELTNDITK